MAKVNRKLKGSRHKSEREREIKEKKIKKQIEIALTFVGFIRMQRKNIYVNMMIYELH